LVETFILFQTCLDRANASDPKNAKGYKRTLLVRGGSYVYFVDGGVLRISLRSKNMHPTLPIASRSSQDEIICKTARCKPRSCYK
jgi:hypothetical protein